MSWSCDEVLAALGDDAQAVASGIVTTVTEVDDEGIERKKHVLVGKFEGMSFVLTAAGTELLETREKPAPKKAKGVSKPKPAVTVVETVDDLDLDV